MRASGPVLLLLLLIGVVLGDLQPPRLLHGLGEELILDTATHPDLIMECEGQQPVYWSWPSVLNQDVFTIVDVNDTESDYPFRSTFTIPNTYVEDTGYYSCHYAENIKEVQIYVYVDDGKYIFVNPNPVLVVTAKTTDDSLIFDCRTGNPNTVVTLTKNGNPVNDSAISFDPRQGFILINLSILMSSSYECATTNNTKTIIARITVNTKKINEPTIEAPGHGHFVVGHPFRLICTVAHNRAVTFTWTNMKNFIGPPAEKVTGSEMTKKSTLIVHAEDVTKPGEVSYECKVEADDYKPSTSRFSVTIKDHEEPHLSVSTDINVIRIENNTPVHWKSSVDSFPGEARINYFNPQGERVVSDVRISVEFNPYEGGDAWLKFNNISNDDFGVWRLEATTDDGLKNSTSLNITVLSAPVVSLLVPRVSLPDSSVPVTCVIVAYPPPDDGTIKWDFANEATGCNIAALIGDTCPNSSFTEFKAALIPSIDRTSNRIIAKARVDSWTSFRRLRCLTSNRLGSKNSSALLVVSDLEDRWTLQVDGRPESRNVTSLQVVENDAFTVRCGGTKHLYNSHQLTAPERVKSNTTITQYSEFTTTLGGVATFDSAGTYDCSVTTHNNYDDKRRSLAITVEPEKRVTLSEESNVELGGVAKLPVKGGDPIDIVCDARGSPEPTIKWTKDDEEIKFDSATVLAPNGKTVVMQVFRQEDVGLYTCIIKWRNERYEASAELFLKDPMGLISKVFLGLAAGFIGTLILGSLYLFRRLRREKAKSEAQKQTRRFLFEKGNVNQLNPDFTAEEQAELLPYDKSFEVEREKIIIGRQLGAGAFGRVVKAEVIGLRDDEERSPVAVKMCKSVTDPTHLRNLAIELKIMIHLGRHLNIVNLVGAYTSEIVKGELWLLVEYCKYGDLLSFLHRYRKRFVNQIDPITDTINYSILSSVSGGATLPLAPGPKTIRQSGTSTFTEGADGYLLPNTAVGGQQLVLANPPKGRTSALPTSPTSPGASSLFADNLGYGKLGEMSPPSTPQDLATIPQSPDSTLSQSPPPYTPLRSSAAVPASPYVNLNPSADGPQTPAYVQHGTRPSLGSRPQRGSCNRSTMGSVSTYGDDSPYSGGSTMGSLRHHVNTDMTTLTASYRPTSPDAYVDSQGRPIIPSDGSDIPGLSCPFTTTELVCWSWQIAQGMEYLTKRKVLHGDLAARNLLLADGNVIKISDFGLSRDMYKKEIYTKQGDDLLPIKWMSVEAIRDRMFSTESDIWAYGIVMWELFSMGQAPYPGVDVSPQFLQDLENGVRCKQPKYSNKELYTLMLDCWRDEPEDRPRFWEIRKRLDDMLKEDIRDNFATMNESYVRMNTDYFENRTDYLSMFTSPDFNNIQKGAEDLPYVNIQSCQSDCDEKVDGAYVSMQQTAGGGEGGEGGNGGHYLAMSVISGNAPPSPKDPFIFSPNPLIEDGDKPKFEFHREEDMPSKMDPSSVSQVDTDDVTPQSPSDKLLLPPVNGTTCPEADDDVHEKNSLLSEQNNSSNYVNAPLQANATQRKEPETNYVNFNASC